MSKFIFKSAIFVFLVIAIIEIYPRIKHYSGNNNDRPFYSLYEMISQQNLDFSKPRDAGLRAFLSDDKRLYITQENASYGFNNISFPIEYENSMEGCLNSYITLSSKVMYEAESNQILFYNVKFMSIVRPLEYFKTLKKLPLIPSHGINCDRNDWDRNNEKKIRN